MDHFIVNINILVQFQYFGTNTLKKLIWFIIIKIYYIVIGNYTFLLIFYDKVRSKSIYNNESI